MAEDGDSPPRGNGFPRKLADEREASEETPLLAASPVAPTQDPDTAETVTSPLAQENKPLPVAQILLLCYARFVEPVAFFSIFPYINQMIKFNGNLPDTDVGFYSGLIESLFSLTQMLVMILWGKAADRLGRKPVLVTSLIGVTVATSVFGLATTIWEMIVFRCLAGVFAGTIVTIRTMISEHSTQKTQARSFSWFAFSGNLGIMLGPLVGGALAEPADQYPGAFGGIHFFKRFPYALPSFAVGVVGLSSVLTTILFVEETLRKEAKGGDEGESGDVAARLPPKSTWELLKAPGVAIVLFCYAHAMLLAFSYTAIVPVFWFTPIKYGGFGFSAQQISWFMGETGLSQAIWLLLIFPPLQHRLGTNGVMRACGIAYPFFMAACPILNIILRQGTDATTKFFWITAPIFLLVGPGVSMAFTGVQLALNDVSPSPETLGTLNALALTGISALRSFTPALFTSLYAVSARTQILQGYLVWVVMVVIAGGFAIAVRFLPKVSEKDYPTQDDGEGNDGPDNER